MFEGDVRDLATTGLLASAAEHHAERNRIDIRLLQHAQHYADLNHPDTNPHPDGADKTLKPGRERSVVLGGAGCPPIKEFAAAEYGVVVLGVSAETAADYLGQALALRHRFPRTWAMVLAGEATAWKACKLAARCLKLSEDAAAIVDRKVAGLLDTLPQWRLNKIIKAAIWTADPEAAEAAAQQKARERGVYIGRSDQHGTKAIWVLAATGDVIRFDATIDAIADALQTVGDTDSLRHRRARALGIIADPAYTLRLLAHARNIKMNTGTDMAAAANTGVDTDAATETTADADAAADTAPGTNSGADDRKAAQPARPARGCSATSRANPDRTATAPAGRPTGTGAAATGPMDETGRSADSTGNDPTTPDPRGTGPTMTGPTGEGPTTGSMDVGSATAPTPANPGTSSPPWTTGEPATTGAAQPRNCEDTERFGADRTGDRKPDHGTDHAGDSGADCEPGVDDDADRDAPHPASSDLPDPLDTPTGFIEPWDPVSCDPREPDQDDPGTTMDPALRRALNARLAQIQQAAHADPDVAPGASAGARANGRGPGRTELVVHLTDHTLATGDGVLRVEKVGPALASQLAELVGHGPYVVKPVMDLNDKVSVDAYEIPDRIRERVKLIHPAEEFPYGTTETTMSTDLDHIEAYDPTGPPGQTSIDNLAPVRRFAHRLKTHDGWKPRRLDDGALQWISPHGFEFRVDHRGTHRITYDEGGDH